MHNFLINRLRQIAGRQDFASWNLGNALVEEDGLPRVWLHGTDSGIDFNIFARWEETSLGFHFGGSASAHMRLSHISSGDEDPNGAIIPIIARA